MASTEAQLAQVLQKLRSMEGTLAVLMNERSGAREAVSEAQSALESVSNVLFGDPLKAAIHAAYQCQKWLLSSDRINLGEHP